MRNKINQTKNGYTIIETMIAVSLFILIVTMGTNALLNATLVHQKSSDIRSIMDNLSFVMEDMSRNLRTGNTYHCFHFTGTIPPALSLPQSCTSGDTGISFESAAGVEWVYYVDTIAGGGGKQGVFRSIAGGAAILLTPEEADINPTSVFYVSGAEPFPQDSRQPFVTIKLGGTIIYKGVTSPFALQTSVSQRQLDSQ